MMDEQISEALKAATPEQLAAELKSRRRAARGSRKMSIPCPKGCGSVLPATTLRRWHRCDGPPKPGDKSPHWDAVSSDTGFPEWPFQESFPTDRFAKCELVLRDGSRVAAWINSDSDEWTWKTFRLNEESPQTRDVAAWKVVEHFA